MIKKIIFTTLIIAITGLSTPVIARIDPGGGGSFGNGSVNTTSTCLPDEIDSVILGCQPKSTNFDNNLIVNYVNTIFGWGVTVIGSVSMLALIYAGYKYITSNGNPDDIKLAKEIVVTSVTALILVTFSYALFKLLGLVS